MFDKLASSILGSDFVSKRLVVFIINKLSIIAVPFLAQYGLHITIDENMLMGCILGLMANAGSYIWAETHRPSKTTTTEVTTVASTPKTETTTVKAVTK
jgi:hypothetical protein